RRSLPVAIKPGQVHQQRGPAGAFDNGADRGPARTDDQISLPMPGNRAVGGFGRTLAKDDILGAMPLRLVLCPCPRLAQWAAGAQHATSSRLSPPLPSMNNDW